MATVSPPVTRKAQSAKRMANIVIEKTQSAERLAHGESLNKTRKTFL